MERTELEMKQRKRIALVAHDNKKRDLLEWAAFNRELLADHELCATGTTARLLQEHLGSRSLRFKAARWAATSRSEERSPRATWIS